MAASEAPRGTCYDCPHIWWDNGERLGDEYGTIMRCALRMNPCLPKIVPHHTPPNEDCATVMGRCSLWGQEHKLDDRRVQRHDELNIRILRAKFTGTESPFYEAPKWFTTTSKPSQPESQSS